MIVVLGPRDDEVADLLGQGLEDLGAVVVLGDVGPRGDDIDDVLGRAVAGAGPLDAVVLASAGRAAAEKGEMAALDAAQWTERVERPLHRTLAVFQGAHRRLRQSGGSLVVLVPTLALVGASGYVPWSTVAEGQRSLAKAAARTWGGEGIRVNTVAVPAALLLPSVTGEEAVPDRPGQPTESLPGSPRLDREVASVVASVVGSGWSGVTGATIAVDGGIWMTP
jgi:3-oxoacyl-[acyl-carrier protein] reductase